MAQWIKLNWNNSFVNRMRLPLLCENTPDISGSYGRQSGRQASWQVDQILVD